MRAARHAGLICTALLVLTAAAGASRDRAQAQDTWNPFKPNSEQPAQRRSKASEAAPPGLPAPRREGADPAGVEPPPWQRPRSAPVERGELEPILAPDASGLPLELWRGLDLKALEGLLAGLELPPRSPALHRLWRRILLSSAPPPAGAATDDHFTALRLEALYRSGLLADMAAILGDAGASGPVVQALRARREIGLGQREEGCRSIAALAAPQSGLPGRLKGETQLLAGYCAAAAGDTSGASLAADLAREEGVDAELPLAVLGGVAAGAQPRLQLPKRVLLLDYRFLELLGPVNAAQIFDKAEPALLAALAGDANGEPRLRVAAAEAGLRLNALAPDVVADIYRRQSISGAVAADPAQAVDPLLRRAMYFKAAEVARAPAQRARFLRALMDDARRSGFAAQMALVAAPLLAGLPPSPELQGFAETGAEMALAAGEFDVGRRWAETTGASRHWLALIDLADPSRRGARPASLALVEDLAYRGRLGAEALHKLATVLDALDIDVPISLWEAASRAPQPTGGYLPDTGILADLAQSAQRKDAGRTILLALRALGANGPEGANILALGDAVRALRRVGLEADARRVGIEALAPAWPRSTAN